MEWDGDDLFEGLGGGWGWANAFWGGGIDLLMGVVYWIMAME